MEVLYVLGHSSGGKFVFIHSFQALCLSTDASIRYASDRAPHECTSVSVPCSINVSVPLEPIIGISCFHTVNHGWQAVAVMWRAVVMLNVRHGVAPTAAAL
jgi:hypothetical protein